MTLGGTRVIPLASGELIVWATEGGQGAWRLDDLLDFAARDNPKRGFLFVSRVLGKHIPAPPHRIRAAWNGLAATVVDAMADEVGSREGGDTVLVVGLCETATGLGWGVAEGLGRLWPGATVVYQHTTRHPIAAGDARLETSERQCGRENEAPWLCFAESHSHAPAHMLFSPLPGSSAKAVLEDATTLVLVDDEVSTGATLAALGSRLVDALPRLRRVIVASLVEWLDDDARERMSRMVGRPTAFANLWRGRFDFVPDPGFQPQPTSAAVATRPGRLAASGFGRRPVVGAPFQLRTGPEPFMAFRDEFGHGVPWPPASDGPLTVVGTTEFMAPPLALAEAWARHGTEVLFQSTTRSPARLGGAMACRREFPDLFDEGVVNYIYNLPARGTVVIAYESATCAQADRLGNGLAASLAREGRGVWQAVASEAHGPPPGLSGMAPVHVEFMLNPVVPTDEFGERS